MILAGDIGGTHTRLLAVQCQNGTYQILHEQIYASQAYASFSAVLREFMQACGRTSAQAACFAIAGPVQDQIVKVTNLPWAFSADELADECHIDTVRLLNDFEAIGYGVPLLSDTDLATLQSGSRVRQGLACIIGAGTGLGQATLERSATAIHVWPGEGGHIDFAPRTDLEYELTRYWASRLERVTNETFLSGNGLYRIFEFLQHMAGPDISTALQVALHSGDPAAAISRAALAQEDATAMRALALFCEIYGAVAGNFALTMKPASGVYIAGGIAPKILPYMQQGGFIAAFNHKAPMQALMRGFNVAVICNERVGQLGAINQACRLAQA